jgi:hypothetical protein
VLEKSAIEPPHDFGGLLRLSGGCRSQNQLIGGHRLIVRHCGHLSIPPGLK